MLRAKSIITIILIIIGATLTEKGLAEIRPGSFSVSPLLGKYFFDGKQELEDGTLFGLRFGYSVTEHWGGEAALDFIDTEFKLVDVGVDGKIFRLDGLYHFLPEGKYVPYVAAGIGVIDLQFKGAGSSSGSLFNWGGGLKLFLNDSLALRGDIRHIIAYSDALSNFAFSVGLTYQFGGEKKKAAFQVRDSDGDGVFDRYDECPHTPAGAPVDSLGCPVDSDGDGVFDYLDKCPDTPAGTKVNHDGCPPPPPAKKRATMRLNVEFDSNRAEIKPEYHLLLKRAAEFMNEHPTVQAVIEGHTDSSGPAEYNLTISQKRADSVKKYLIDNFGVDPSRVKAIGYGETRPIADNGTDSGREINRRVMVTISSDSP